MDEHDRRAWRLVAVPVIDLQWCAIAGVDNEGVVAHGESLCRELAALCTLAVITQSTVEFPSSRKDRLRITTFIAKFSPSMTPSSYLRRRSELLLSGQSRTAGQITSGEEDKNNAT
jgi:hypothetical protein